MAGHRVVLVVEGDPPELVSQAVDAGRPTPSARYAAALTALDPTVSIRVVSPGAGPIDASALEGVVGAALTGASCEWSADAPEAAPHRAFLERLFAIGLPVFGSCWGLNVAVAVLGGALRASPKGPEFGVARAVTLTATGRNHAMFDGKPTAFDTICMHRDEVARAPEGARVLAGNAHSAVQAMAYEAGGVRFWGAQYHPELGLDAVADALEQSGAPYVAGAFSTSGAAIAADFRRMADDGPEAAALKRRYGVADDAAMFNRRARELGNWLASLPDA